MNTKLLAVPMLAVVLAAPLLGRSGASADIFRSSQPKFAFGKVIEGTTSKQQITLENISGGELTIDRLTVDCPCGEVRLATSKRPNVPVKKDDGKCTLKLSPGDSATLTLIVDTKDMEEGNLTKNCFVFTDKASEPFTLPFELAVTAPPERVTPTATRPLVSDRDQQVVVPDGPQPKIEADELLKEFGEILRGQQVSHTFTLKNAGEGELVIKNIQSTCTCTLSKLVIDDEELDTAAIKAGGGQGKVGVLGVGKEAQLVVTMDTSKLTSTRDKYPVRKQVRVYTNDPLTPTLTLTLNGELVQPFAMEPTDLRFPTMRKGESAEMDLTIHPRQIKDYEITSLSVTNKDQVSAEISVLPDGGHKLHVKMTPNKVGRIADSILLKLTHEEVKELKIPVYANVLPQVIFTGNGAEGSERLDFEVMDGTKDVTLELKIENLEPEVPFIPDTTEMITRVDQQFLSYELVEVEKGAQYALRVTVSKDMPIRFFHGKIRIESAHPDVPVKLIDFRGWIDRTKAEGAEVGGGQTPGEQ